MTKRRVALIAVWLILGAMAGVALADTIQCPNLSARCEGTNGDDIIYGTNNFDIIYAYSGSDRPIYGYDDKDYIHGGRGYDTAWGGDKGDSIYGGQNSINSWDRLIGQHGNDYLKDTWNEYSTGDPDAVCGGDGDDEMHIDDTDYVDKWNGGDGNDVTWKERGDTWVTAGECNGGPAGS